MERPRIGLHKKDPLQPAFHQKDQEVTVLPDFSFLQIAQKAVVERKLFKNRPQRKNNPERDLLVSYPSADRDFLVNGKTFQVIGELLPHSVEKSDKFAAIVVVIDSIDKTRGMPTRFLTRRASTILDKEGAFFMVEKKGEDMDKEWRKIVLKTKPMVKANVVTKDGNIIWEAQVAKKRKKPRESNLYESKNEGTRIQIARNTIIARAVYESLGFVVVNCDEIEKRLKHSRNHRKNLYALKDGFGFELLSPCGCISKIDVDGIKDKHQMCEDANCDNVLATFSGQRPVMEKKLEEEGLLVPLDPLDRG